MYKIRWNRSTVRKKWFSTYTLSSERYQPQPLNGFFLKHVHWEVSTLKPHPFSKQISFQRLSLEVRFKRELTSPYSALNKDVFHLISFNGFIPNKLGKYLCRIFGAIQANIKVCFCQAQFVVPKMGKHWSNLLNKGSCQEHLVGRVKVGMKS